MVLSLRFGAVSDIGRSRKKNDDSGYAGRRFAMVADGMGGAPAGDLASAVAVQTIRRLDDEPPDDMLAALAGALRRANERLAELIDEDASIDGMGTTITAALFDEDRMGLAHLGDSRGYLWRDGKLQQITRDHTWVQTLIDEGRITEEQAVVHAYRSLLLKVLDGKHDNDPDLTLYDVKAGDRILLCSDGLSGFVDKDRIERVMSIGDPQQVAAELTRLALEAGSTDNVTVVVADVVEGEPTDAEALVVGAAADNPRTPLARLRTWTHREASPAGEILMEDPDVDPEEVRYAPRPPRRFIWLKRSLILLAVLALLIVGGAYGYKWTQHQYYVGADGRQVAIYQGLEGDLPGIRLHHVYEDQDLLLSELPSFRRSQVVDGLTGGSLAEARAIVDQLRGFASTCAHQASQSPVTTLPPTTLSPRTTPNSTRHSSAQPPTGRTSSAPASPHPSSTPLTAAGPGQQSSNTPAECAGSTPTTPEMTR
jgi:PPM family protein phosphatase